MAGNRNGWTDVNKEGKILRRLVNKLNKLMDKDDLDVDKFLKLAHCIANVALAKNRLAEGSQMRKDLDDVMAKLGMK